MAATAISQPHRHRTREVQAEVGGRREQTSAGTPSPLLDYVAIPLDISGEAKMKARGGEEPRRRRRRRGQRISTAAMACLGFGEGSDYVSLTAM